MELLRFSTASEYVILISELSLKQIEPVGKILEETTNVMNNWA